MALKEEYGETQGSQDRPKEINSIYSKFKKQKSGSDINTPKSTDIAKQ